MINIVYLYCFISEENGIESNGKILSINVNLSNGKVKKTKYDKLTFFQHKLET